MPTVPGAARVAGEERQSVTGSVLGCQFLSAEVTHRQIPGSPRQYDRNDRSSLSSWVSKAGLPGLKSGHWQPGSYLGAVLIDHILSGTPFSWS